MIDKLHKHLIIIFKYMDSNQLYKITSTAVSVGGSVDSGKSSIIGVLMSGVLDNGDGSARKLVAKHKHEHESGRTSDISTRICDIEESNKAVTLIDLCGHEDYFKTTTFGVSGHFPDYAFLIVSPHTGIRPMTKQHLRLFLSLSIPILIVVTHIDSAPESVYENTIEEIKKVCAVFGSKAANPICVNDLSQCATCTGNINDIDSMNSDEKEIKSAAIRVIAESLTGITDGKQTTFPILSVSNKTGFFIDVLKKVLGQLTDRQFWLPGGEKEINNNKVIKMFKICLERQKRGLSSILPQYKEFDGGIFYVDSVYDVKGIGMVVTGINRGKSIETGLQSYMYLGPFGKEFKKIRVKSLHNNNRQMAPVLENHHRGCINFALVDKGEVKKNSITKGTVLLSSLDLTRNICYRFKAVITIFTNSNTSLTLKTGYSPVIHLHTIRQTARATIDPSENGGRDVIEFSGKNAIVVIATFKFKQHPEFIEPLSRFLLRSGSIQGVGLVIGTIPIENDPDAHPDMQKSSNRFRRKTRNYSKHKQSAKPSTK